MAEQMEGYVYLSRLEEKKTGNGFTGPEIFSGIPGWLSRYKKVS
jgi:hypothetical protein